MHCWSVWDMGGWWVGGKQMDDGVRMGGSDGFRTSREGVCVCLNWRGGRFAFFSHLSPRRSTSERGHGYWSCQHWPHLWSQHGKVFSPPSFYSEIYHSLTSLLQQRSKICYLHNPDLSHLRVWKHSVWTCVTHWLSCLIIWYFHGFCTARTKSGGKIHIMYVAQIKINLLLPNKHSNKGF